MHVFLRVRLFTHVRMVFAGQLAVGLHDFIRRGGFLHAEDLIVILEFHFIFPPFPFLAVQASRLELSRARA